MTTAAEKTVVEDVPKDATEQTQFYVDEWAIKDDDVVGSISAGSWIWDYLAYGYDCTDAPVAYHMATGFTVLSTVVARNCEVVSYSVTNGVSRVQREPLNLWSMLVGDSGDRKSQSMDLGLSLLHDRFPDILLPGDGSLEAWHDTLASDEYGGLGLLHRDELAFLLDQTRRSYSEGLRSWLLQLYSGHATKRVTKSGGTSTIARPRVSILGAIPPEVLSKKMKPEDWQSGFAARFLVWNCRRQRYQKEYGRIPQLHDALANWLVNVAAPCHGDVVYRDGYENLIHDWSFKHVESRRTKIPPSLFSSLVRLAQHAFRIAALLEIAKLKAPFYGELPISKESVESALKIVDLLRLSLLKMFGLVTATEDTGEENGVLDALKAFPDGVSVEELRKGLNISYSKLYRVLQHLIVLNVIYREKKPGHAGHGRVPLLYKLTSANITPQQS